MVSQLLLSLLFSLGLLLPSGAQPTAVQELYVKPTEDTSCPEPCHTLDEYVQNATQYFVSNTAFKFLPGTHSLSQSLTVSGVSNLAMVGNSSGSVHVICIDSKALTFVEISNLTLENLTLSCVLNLADLLNVNLLRVSMEPCPHGFVVLYAENIFGTSSFARLQMVGISDDSMAKIMIQYVDHISRLPPSSNQLTIENSNFSLSDHLSIEVFLYQSNYGVNILFESLNAVQSINLVESTSLSSSSVRLNSCMTLASLQVQLESTPVLVENSVFQARNAYVPAFVVSGLQSNSMMRNVAFHNGATTGTLLSVFSVTNLSFVDCKFLNNKVSESMSTIRRTAQVIGIFDSKNISFTGCEFSNNQGTAIYAKTSQYIMSGSNTFINNSAYEGGAMAFCGQSYVTFTDGSDIRFLNNSALLGGGAIHVDPQSEYNLCFFQLQRRFKSCDQDIAYEYIYRANLTLRFDGNNADNGGSNIYGASLDACAVNSAFCQGWTFARPLFHFDPRNTSDFSAITSDPLRVCLCEDGRPSCTAVFNGNRTHYPGETFNLSAVVVGDRFGTTDGSVYAHILPASNRIEELGQLQRSQRVEHQKCTNVSYTIFSSDSAITIALTASSARIRGYPSKGYIGFITYYTGKYIENGSISPRLGTAPVYINVTLLPCPLGFVLSGDPPGCVCDTQLQENHISCDLFTQTVQRSGTEWVGASFDSNGSSNGVIVSKYCPNNYCEVHTVDFNLNHPDTQCAFHHSGILCGGCQSGLSLALGSAQCLQCSNAYLALLIPFALAGFVLMFFIKLLNLTVAVGSLNGLIFYANIVQANQVVWNLAETSILRVFIAWLNLDLGIETCFFDGLDAYWKTWLQFVFPLYIWAIVILIIVLSHYFSTAAKIFGNNSVPTLATLFLLSYPKLLRTIISIFQFSTIDYPDGTSEAVWSYDGNIAYLGPKHIPLFLVGVIVILFLWLPYTGTLIYAQCLQRSSNKTVGKIFARLKPFLDAYFGPLKDKHRYWVGLLLLVRGILFIVFAATPTMYSEVNLIVTLAAAVGIMVYLLHVGSVYKRIYLSLLEISFFLNLAALAGGTLLAGKSQSSLLYTGIRLLNASLSIAFIGFVIIVSVHSVICLKKTGLGRTLRHLLTPGKPQAIIEDGEDDELENEPVVDRPAVQRLVMSYGDYREPVLKYIDSLT